MKLNKILWRMGNDFRGEYKCEFCGTIKTDKNATSYYDAYFLNNVIPKMFCEKCKKNSKGETKE